MPPTRRLRSFNILNSSGHGNSKQHALWETLLRKERAVNAASGFGSRLHGHGNKGAHEECRAQLTNDSLTEGERACERMYRSDVAAQAGKYAKTKIGELRRELVDVHRRGDELDGSGVALLYKLVGRCPRHAEKKVGAYAALNAAPSDRPPAKHNEQDDAHIEKERDGGENTPELMEERSRVEAPQSQNNAAKNDDGNYESSCDAGLV